MAYAEHDFYLNTYFGDVVTDSDAFKRLSTRASEWLDHFTMHKIDQSDISDAVRLATCAMTEVLYYEELRKKSNSGREIASESNDGYSVTFASASDAERNKQTQSELYLSAYKYLSQTGLMDFGVDQ